MSRRLFLSFILLLNVFCVYAESDILNRKITLRAKKQTIPEILKQIESLADVTFSYNIKLMPEGKFNVNANNDELNVVLVNLLQPHKLTFSVLYGNHIIIQKLEKKSRKFTVSGYVTDEVSGEKLIGVSVYDQYTLSSTVTNQDGYYTLSLEADSVWLVFSHYPHLLKESRFLLKSHTMLNIEMTGALDLPRFTITGRPENQNRFKPDQTQLSMTTIKQLPVLFGETDVMKGLQLMPGVSSGNDGTIGLNIRGGGPDQNLILLDDVPIYNPSHIFGFFSIFNSDIVKDVLLIKGGTSSRYSGRLSSVVDVRTLDGNTKKIKVQPSIGILSSKLTIDGPIGKGEKTTFIISARRSYIDILNAVEWSPILSNQYSPLKTGYYFFDANGKINHKFSDKHQISASFYSGQDNLFIRNSFSLKNPDKEITEKDRQSVFWGNKMVSIRDHHIWSPRLSAWMSLAYTSYDFGNESNYQYSENTDTQQIANRYNYRFVSKIINSIAAYHLEYKIKEGLSAKAGAGLVLHDFRREISSSDDIIKADSTGNSTTRANEYNAYFELNWNFRRKIFVQGGMHGVSFNLKDKSYPSLQPRLSLNYRPNKSWIIHGAYQRTVQFLHLLTSATNGIPIDLWLPSTSKVAPETADLWSAGCSYSKGDWVLNLESFYKLMNNVIDYKDQANYIGADTDWEQKITVGMGESYGTELMLEKRNGRTRGWLSYTLSWNNRKFSDINGGRLFPHRYDRRHNLAVFMTHDFNKQVDASLSWSLSSGSRYTIPEQVYFLNSGLSPNNIIYIYGDRNNYQFPTYHRLDLGFNFKKVKSKYSRILSVGAYNVYNRLNPFYISPAYNKEGDRVFEAISLFPFIPSIGYKIIF